ncbi:MAG: heavy-metal-associated domain-containing protein [Erysipelotrichaceae bacterium]|nr:heavy-metal-associated domain-containing protein [Erysipelotrichaceae bacterium]
MLKVTLKIEGMACGMCEAHMNDTVRKAVRNAEKVSSSYKKGETVFLTQNDIDEEALKKAINETGYQCLEIRTEQYKKKGLFGLW